MKTLITGASGFLGSHLCEYFLNKGFKVVGLSRKRGFLDELKDVKWIKCDLTDEAQVGNVSFSDFDLIIHNAGLISSPFPDRFWEVNALATHNIVCALERQGFSGVLVYISSLAVSGPGKKRENDPCNPITTYGKSKLLAERIVSCSSLKWLVIRPPVIFGERDWGLLTLYRILEKGIALKWIPQKYVSVVYAKTVAAFLDFLLQRKIVNEIFFVKDADMSWNDMASLYKKIRGKKLLIPIYLHNGIVSLVKPLFSLLNCISKRESILSADKLEEMKQHYWIADDSKAKALGFSSPYSLELALAATISWYVERGLL